MSLSQSTLDAMMQLTQDNPDLIPAPYVPQGNADWDSIPQNAVSSPERIKQIEHKLLVLLMVRAGISGLGTIGGWVYANKTGGGFWRYIGFGLMGGIAFGTISFIATIPSYSKLDEELKNLK
jgi:hypothetical protein